MAISLLKIKTNVWRMTSPALVWRCPHSADSERNRDSTAKKTSAIRCSTRLSIWFKCRTEVSLPWEFHFSNLIIISTWWEARIWTNQTTPNLRKCGLSNQKAHFFLLIKLRWASREYLRFTCSTLTKTICKKGTQLIKFLNKSKSLVTLSCQFYNT